MSELADLTAVELLTGYREGAFSPVEATSAALDRIRALDGRVNAFCLVDEEGALAAAAESQERWRRGEPRGALDGVPASVKDLLVTRGWPTRRGSRTTDPDAPADADAPSVARLREADAVLLGKTTTPEYGWKGVTDSPLTGITRNPWDHSRTPGGSSGGSAAAVALGMGPLSLGTDGGGSVRIPAAFSGITGLKPTYGRVPLYPASPFGTLSHVGPMTRSAADAALLLDVVSGADPRDAWALPPARPAGPQLVEGVTGARIAFSPTLGHVDVHPEVAAAVAAAVRVFGGLGATVEQVDPGFDDPIAAFQVLWFCGAAAVLEPLRDRHDEMDPGLVAAAEVGAGVSAVEYLEASAVRNDLGALMGAFHERHDLLLTPTMPIAAFEAGRDAPPDRPSQRWTSWTPFTYPFNLTQQPAATVPCGRTSEGLPIGLQIVGPRHADAAVLAAAHAFQQATGFHRVGPPV
ncbi:amidase [Pseudonocardia humida]|uniref:Amidase n=1 Tax=Pseudonocardia humida TaxID=2800819 RepID=A0ABT1A3F6_9PSEU|nr:amidase [Pseudonocardia humida]MCO1657541.1 amidase [Pseudonocardia humida]